MQTTLLGLAIAFILALLAALIGPYFVDWTQFRPQFEAEATRALGTAVRVGGALDARLLPVPSLRLNGVSIGGPNDPGRLSAGRFDVEFSLGALMRGELRATELTVSGLSMDLGIDDKGQLDWPAVARVDLRALTIERLNVTGRLALHDASSRSTLELRDIAFAGDVRGSAGAVRGDGNFDLRGTRYPFRLNTSSSGDQSGTRVRLAVDANAVPVLIDLEGQLALDDRRPRFDGTLVLARPAKSDAGDLVPWRAVTKLKTDPSRAVMEQVEVAIGADDTALRLAGNGEMRFGSAPLLRATLAAKTLDGDRLLGANAGAAAALPALTDFLTGLPQVPFAAELTTAIEQINLGGRPVQDVTVELRSAGQGWSVNRLDFRGPGATRVTLAGAFRADQASGFDGRLDLVSADPDAFANWAQGRSETTVRLQKPLRIGGHLMFAAGKTVLDGLAADIEGSLLKGRFALLRPDGAASRIEANLQADRIDLDATFALLQSLRGRDGWPDEGQIVLDIGRAVAAGQEMKPFGLAFGYTPRRITLDRMRIGEATGVTLDGSGVIDREAATGTLSLNASTPSLARLAALLQPGIPVLAARLASVPSDGPAKLTLALGLDADAAKSDRVKARASLSLDAAALKGTVAVNASPPAAILRSLDTDQLRRSELALDAKLSAPRGRVLSALLGFDNVLAVGDAPLTLEGSASGVWLSSWRGTAKVTGPALDANAQGSLDAFAEPRTADLRLAVRRANIAPLLGLPTDSPLARDVSLTSKLIVAGDRFSFDGIDGVVAGTRLRGRAALNVEDGRAIDGEIGLDRLDIGPAFALAIGGAGRDANDPLGPGWLQGWRGRLGFVALRAVLPGGNELQPFSGALRNDGQALTFEALKAKLGGGDVTGEIEARPGVSGVALSAQVQTAPVEGAALNFRGLAVPADQASLRMSLATQGRSASALLSALSGEGVVSLNSARISGLDPKAFEAAIAASDQARVADDLALRRIVEPTLSAGALAIASGQVPFTVKDGRVRVNGALLEAADARLILSGGYDITADQADIRASLSAPKLKGVGNSLPELQVFAVGPPDRMTRAIDIGPLSAWLAIRSIDRETKRLDALERGLPALASVPPGTEAPAALAPTAPAFAPSSSEPVPAPTPRPRAPRIATPAIQTPPPSDTVSAPPLPPAIDVGPPPGAARVVRPRPPMPLTITPPAPRPSF